MKPARIIIEPHQVGWKMTIEDEAGTVLDYTLSSSRWLVWGMAKLSWCRLSRTHNDQPSVSDQGSQFDRNGGSE